LGRHRHGYRPLAGIENRAIDRRLNIKGEITPCPSERNRRLSRLWHSGEGSRAYAIVAFLKCLSANRNGRLPAAQTSLPADRFRARTDTAIMRVISFRQISNPLHAHPWNSFRYPRQYRLPLRGIPAAGRRAAGKADAPQG